MNVSTEASQNHAAAEIRRAVSAEADALLKTRGASIDRLLELGLVHRSLWDQEDRVREHDLPAEDVARLKRSIDRANARRHELIDQVDATLFQSNDTVGGRTYSETPGELCDRLLILDLKLEHAVRYHVDATLPADVRQRCLAKASTIRSWRQHLQHVLVDMLRDIDAQLAHLPPRSEFKIYNDPELNPVLRISRNPSGTTEHRRRLDGQFRNVLGIASTGHGASLAYLDRDGAVRATVLDRWANSKHTLLLTRDEVQALQNPVTDVDRLIHHLWVYAHGRFPPFRVFEDNVRDWVDWFLADLGHPKVELVVTSDSYFAVGPERLGPSLQKWFPHAFVVSDVEHHEVHQRQAFWSSGFEEAAVLTLDTCGEELPRLGGRKICGSICLMDRGGRCQVLHEFLFPESSAGLIYSLVTRHLGFRQGEEGKTMGLSAYGEPGFYEEEIAPHLHLRDDGSFEFLPQEQFEALLEGFVTKRELGRHNVFSPQYAAAAYAGQAVIEAVVVNAMQAALNVTRLPDLAYGGGIALNSVANEIARQKASPRCLYIAPNPGDVGHALGCAMLGAYELAGWTPPEAEVPEYLGPAYAPDIVAAAARASGNRARRSEQAEKQLVQCIANGHIVARFAGQAEFGPRALGNRSILADPRRPDMKDFLNARVKRRESFRPFAPAVLLEYAAQWFECEGPSAYMLRVVRVHEEQAHRVPAIVHVDGSARLQTVDRRENGPFWSLIEAFRQLTGVPMVLNTSFNVAGSPLVETPQDAVDCFESTEIDILVLEDWILSKRPLDELAKEAR